MALLEIGDRKEEFNKNLVQIGTSEEKSLTLRITASILTLLGFDVYCACYSEYLTLINYVCEKIINENDNICQTYAKILLIDEVNVFFSQDFYGNVYASSASLRDPTITSLVNFIWKARKSKLNLNKVKVTNDVNNFDSPRYEVNHNKIGYTWNRIVLSTMLSMIIKLYLHIVMNMKKRQFLVEENKGIEGNWCSRTVCLMDATSLITNLLHKCKNTVNIMFECAFKVSKDNNINTDSFQIQFVEYQSSPWETKPDNLRAFMNTIEVERGWNN
ncbi:unnamed protein product [Rotaria sordida]|uniref:Uncharacterized protein n=1 Tax=Rotaria sordida TaxID=392033 RepID=A0A819IM47_9BILA|nr:unnamed protein product [Rotaria sordida]